MSDAPQLTKKDFVSDQDVRWCPGCGDYAILAQVQRVMPTLGVPLENFVFISGIGCSSRFPYYMNTYGMHSIHGRAPAFATGLKTANPELNVWLVTGDGDALSIGGNHLAHILRRNVDVKILLFNNRIYGLTKGQYSPTSLVGHKTKSTPMGSVDNPFNPVSFALGSEATFVARTVDVEAKHQQKILAAAAHHKGAAFVEILQNCNIFNDGAWANVTDRATKADNQLVLEHGKPMRFGKKGEKGIALDGFHAKVVNVGEGGVSEDELLVHDANAEEPHLAFLLSRLDAPEFPVPIGVFRDVKRPTYDAGVRKQVESAQDRAGGLPDMNELYNAGNTWKVSANGQPDA